ncbi:MAG: hypothetical protein JW741_02745 [Sedimentisphaerales bacterium]|nr:hypothetical protein [Sedimentisphaerales bacterium]
MSRSLGPDARWVRRHVAQCPRCRKRLADLGRVDWALRIIKSQPHGLDLLRRANTRAVRMLNHELRDGAHQRRLDEASPEPALIERCRRYENVAVNVAACIAILFLTKAGLFSSFGKARTEGHQAMKQYYATQAGQDLADEIFQN